MAGHFPKGPRKDEIVTALPPVAQPAAAPLPSAPVSGAEGAVPSRQHHKAHMEHLDVVGLVSHLETKVFVQGGPENQKKKRAPGFEQGIV